MNISKKSLIFFKLCTIIFLFFGFFSVIKSNTNVINASFHSLKINEEQLIVEYGSDVRKTEEIIAKKYPSSAVLRFDWQSNTNVVVNLLRYDFYDFENINVDLKAKYISYLIEEKDTIAPIIEAKDVSIEVGDEFNEELLEIKAYDVVDGSLDYTVKTDVNTNQEGSYTATITALDKHQLKSEKEVKVEVVKKVVNTPAPVYVPNYEVIDETTIKVRGKIVKLVNNPSQGIVNGWVSQMYSVPDKFWNCISYLEINTNIYGPCNVNIQYVAACTYRADNHVVLNGSILTYNQVPLHEALHAFDNENWISEKLIMSGAYNNERYNIPKQEYNVLNQNEFFVNAALIYLSNPESLKASCPQTYEIISKYI